MKALVWARQNWIAVTWWFSLVLTAVLITVSMAAAGDLGPGREAPDFSTLTVTGDRFSLSEHKGETVLLTFWSTWCALNKDEIAFFSQIKARYPELVLVIVDAGSARPDIKALAQVWQAVGESDIRAVVIADRRHEITDLYRINTLPTSLIINSQGNVAFAEPNFFWPTEDKVEGEVSRGHAVSQFVPVFSSDSLN